jgi:RDD family
MNPLTKLTTFQKLALIVYGFLIVGILSESMALIPFRPGYSATTLMFVKNLLATINLSYFDLGFLEYENSSNGLKLSYLNVFFYLIFLLGAIIYSLSAQKESRLIRFILSIIFLQSILLLLSGIFSHLYYFKMAIQNGWLWRGSLFMVKNSFFAYLAYFALTVLKKTKNIDAEFRELEEEIAFIPNEASNWQRLLHLIIDAYVCLFLFSRFAHLLVPNILEKITSESNERNAIVLFLLAAQLIYYPFFEYFLNATPAKLLTESRVTSNIGEVPRFGAILGRTFARYIPFSPLSFLFSTGWHDRLSNTVVVREVRTGVNGARYLLIIPAFILLFILGILGYQKYEDYIFYQSQKSYHDKEVSAIKNGLKQLSTADIVEIEEVDDYFLAKNNNDIRMPTEEESLVAVELGGEVEEEEFDYSRQKLFLKIEKMNKDSLDVTLIPTEITIYNSLPLLEIERLYLRNKASFRQFKISLSDLNHAYTEEFKLYDKKYNASRLIGGKKHYRIKQIARLFEPNLRLGSGSISSGVISLDLENYGWPAQLVDIIPVSGKVKWKKSDLPADLPFIYPRYHLQGMEYIQQEEYQLQLIVVDSTQRKHKFFIKGVDFEHSIKKIK